VSDQYVISMTVLTGDPFGAISVGKTGWIGRALVFPRSQMASVKSELDKPGVYFLIGESLTEYSKKSLYIGEAEKVSDRLSTHQSDREKDFWTKTIVFVSNDRSLNKADVRFLESELIKQAKIVDSWQVLNVKNSVLNSLSEEDTIKTRDFLKVLLQIAPLIDLDAFEGSSLKGLTKLYISGPGCKGQGEDQAGGFLVLKGALLRKDGTSSFPERYKAMRQSLISDGRLADLGDSYELTDDYLFTSSSTAASVLLGRSANGRTEWRDVSGKPLADIQVD
jgi:hypothetical protein